MTTPPSNPAPDYTIANNPHAYVHCGPIGPGSQDDGRDFCIITSTNNHCVYHKDGSKVEHIQDAWHEVSGHSIDGTKKEAIARSIVAKNGDLIINAERGNIHLKAKNIHIETTGEKNQGNFLVSSNGHVIIASTKEVRIAASRLCLNGTSGVNIVTENFVNVMGLLEQFPPQSMTKSITSLLQGNWESLLKGLSQSCGSTGTVK
jgi:hypothetical protein